LQFIEIVTNLNMKMMIVICIVIAVVVSKIVRLLLFAKNNLFRE